MSEVTISTVEMIALKKLALISSALAATPIVHGAVIGRLEAAE